MKNNVTMTLKSITPELAQHYLSMNVKNRRVQDNQVQFYLRQMKSGQWKITGDPVKLSSDGALLDGQHRLLAIVAYGQPVEMFVAEGLEPESFEVIDTGKPRTAGDVLSVFGVEKAINVAAIVRFILLFKMDKKHASWFTRTVSPSHSDVLDFVQKHPHMNEILDFVHKVYRDFRYLPVSVIGGFYFLFAEKNQTKADKFFMQYKTGLELTKTDPVYWLRDRFLKNEIQKTKLTRKEKLMLFVTAWNYFVQDKPMTRLSIPDKFPNII